MDTFYYAMRKEVYPTFQVKAINAIYLQVCLFACRLYHSGNRKSMRRKSCRVLGHLDHMYKVFLMTYASATRPIISFQTDMTLNNTYFFYQLIFYKPYVCYSTAFILMRKPSLPIRIKSIIFKNFVYSSKNCTC